MELVSRPPGGCKHTATYLRSKSPGRFPLSVGPSCQSPLALSLTASEVHTPVRVLYRNSQSTAVRLKGPSHCRPSVLSVRGGHGFWIDPDVNTSPRVEGTWEGTRQNWRFRGLPQVCPSLFALLATDAPPCLPIVRPFETQTFSRTALVVAGTRTLEP